MKKRFALLLAAVVLATLFAGCNAESSPKETGGLKELKYARTYDPTTLDPHNTVDNNSSQIIMLTNEGLVRNRDGVIVPGIAYAWEISDDGYEYTFHLRESVWSDGTPLTAHDFVYSFLRVVDPETAYEQATFAYTVIENSEAYHTGEITDTSLVGVKALDDYTLYVKTTVPNIETLDTFTRYPWLPIKQEVAEAAGIGYGSEASKVSNNGPFTVVSWAHQDKIILEKNQNYWDKDSINLDRIVCIIGAENQTGADMMMAGSLDYMTTSQSEVMQQLKDAGFKVGSYSSHMQSLLFGSKDAEMEQFMQNSNFLLALNLVIDRKAITDTLFTGGIPATRISTPTTSGVDGRFIDEYPYEGWPVNGDPEKARYHLNLALEELGKTIDDVPELSILCYESANSVLVIQAVQDMLRVELGIKSRIDQVPIQQMFSKAFSGDFDLWWTGMAVGTMDWGSPDGFLRSFDWRDAGYTGTWKDEEFARLLDIVNTTTDMKVRKDSLFEIEKILINDNPPFILVAYTQQFCIYRDTLTGPEFKGYDDITYMDFK